MLFPPVPLWLVKSPPWHMNCGITLEQDKIGGKKEEAAIQCSVFKCLSKDHEPVKGAAFISKASLTGTQLSEVLSSSGGRIELTLVYIWKSRTIIIWRNPKSVLTLEQHHSSAP